MIYIQNGDGVGANHCGVVLTDDDLWPNHNEVVLTDLDDPAAN
ncbi:hypothetical protein [Streptomyces sp. NPDC051909]